ncbi:MAG: PIN domain-containing protein [Gammaproteobacteria bacterium]|nr:PIN domain-containing protein [Gammaproteobacteria bacterium]MXW45763.1 PIN domain-containing protein [Gammaproteobacteria bacterium]MYD03127.1 PIN domain-containing protein [Gammaproteobacteria bacterium]MYE49535.1 PIN domain-containing protein [Gammaproteobacteria bacterium]MYI25750.1 PIN domain-containing protein [Gammaproteobacteria bacterium]
MARPTVVLDTGPLIALLDRDEAHHAWAALQFRKLRPPLLTCDSVLSEASFLLQRAGLDPSLPIEFLMRGVLEVASPFTSRDGASSVRSLMRRYRNVPMSFTDACLVVLVERTKNSSVLTLDSDFRIYRQTNRRVISLLIP